MSSNIATVGGAIESFGKNPDEFDLSGIEEGAAFVEWLEKVEGDVEQAVRLHYLPVDLPAPDDPEAILDPRGWSYEDPADPTEFTCPVCSGEMTIVEGFSRRTGEGTVALGRHGHISDVAMIGDDSAEGAHSLRDDRFMCGPCHNDLRRPGHSTNSPNTIRYFDGDETAKVHYQNGVVWSEGGQYTDYRDLPAEYREAVEAVVLGEPVSDDFYQPRFESSRLSKQRNQVRWLNSWACEDYSESVEGYHFNWPTLVVSTTRGIEIAGGKLLVPDTEEAREEADDWFEIAKRHGRYE